MTHAETRSKTRFQTALRSLHFAFNAVTLVLATVLIGADVLLRYVFNAPLSWGIEATSLLLLIMVFASLPYVWEREGHIRMELVYHRLGGMPRMAADLATAFCGGLFSGLLCYEMLRNASSMRAMNEGAEHLGVPYWPFAVFIAAIAVVMTLQFIVFAVRAVLEPQR